VNIVNIYFENFYDSEMARLRPFLVCAINLAHRRWLTIAHG
jgi:hypothetical protein